VTSQGSSSPLPIPPRDLVQRIGLLEHHRVLADGGLLLLSFLREGMSVPLTGEAWDEDRTGMNPLLHGYPWELGGTIAFNSEWWIRAHWGRAFEIVNLVPHDGADPPHGHGFARLRRRPVATTEEELLRLRAENAHLRELLTAAEAAAGENEQIRTELEGSSSWRLTAPLRAAKGRLGS
jgi:hypothetical protein